MNLGPAEVAVILLVALLVFGPSRLPEISRQVGGAMRELRKMQSSLRHEIDNAMREQPVPAAASAPPEIGTTGVEAASRPEPDHTDVDPGGDDGFPGPRDSFL